MKLFYSKANKYGAMCVWIYLFIIRKAHGHACTDYILKVYKASSKYNFGNE